MFVKAMLCLPQNPHFQVRQELCLPRNLQFEVCQVLCLPQNPRYEVREEHFEVHQALCHENCTLGFAKRSAATKTALGAHSAHHTNWASAGSGQLTVPNRKRQIAGTTGPPDLSRKCQITT